MRILQIMPEFGLAGAERMAENLTLSQIRAGHEVKVVSLYDFHSAITDNLESKGVEIIYLNKKGGIDLPVIGRLKNVIESFSPDVIHTHRYILFYTFLARTLSSVKAPIVHTVHNEAKKELIFVYRKINNLLFLISKCYPVALTKKIKETIIDEYFGLKKFPIIMNGVNTDNIHPIKTDYKATADAFNIIHVGRFAEAKNHETIVDAFAEFHKKHPHSTLTFFGTGEKFERIKEKVNNEKLADSIIFKGVDGNVTSHFHEYDAFILPSLFEGMPITIIEAMAAGLPIIASNVGGIPDIMTNGKDGILINPEKDDIAMALEELANNEELRKQLGEGALKSSKLYTSDQMAKEYVDYYQTLIKK
ncbi:MAG: glycosyltransferase family 4 protein [Paludibacteraceae bacterium]|nr:glycosyltransferase family 4 protein [Paludibacteraceae bacterium]